MVKDGAIFFVDSLRIIRFMMMFRMIIRRSRRMIMIIMPMIMMILEEEQKTLMSGLDLDINLCQDLMSRSHVRISCHNQMCIFQLDFPCLLLSISQYLAICIYHCPFQFDFPFLLRSISQNWNSAFTNAFLGFWTPCGWVHRGQP